MNRHDHVRIGCGSGFWGDAADPAFELLEHGRLDYLGFDYLAELTMALLQRLRAKDPDAGFVEDAVQTMTDMAPLARRAGTRLVSNGGGVNPRAGARAIAQRLAARGERGVKIATVVGDDLLGRLDELVAAGVPLANSATGSSDLASIRSRIVCANAYLGSEGIIEALGHDPDIVITGRVADSAVFVGPILAHLGAGYEDPDLVAAAITVGHIAECSSGCTGGMSSRFDEMEAMGRAGFPIIEFARDGRAVITKLPGTGGRVDAFTVKEHLVYEIGDPRGYPVPDGVADFTSVRLAETGPDRVEVSGVRGRPRPKDLKVLIGYADGWIGEGLLMFPWPRALARARKARTTLLERFDRLGLAPDAVEFSFVGINALHGPAAPMPERDDLNEVGLRVAVRTRSRDDADKVRRACSQLWIMGPGGTSFGVPMKPRPVVSLWPTFVPRELVPHSVEVVTS
ncbi:MAG TPA: acyclic terpene utilization AtuA family protein [Casimicrobiaceae bacterium]|nr:acyclic terpene utilization AtuA family protein [Casimicrobiaceae bacterium]